MPLKSKATKRRERYEKRKRQRANRAATHTAVTGRGSRPTEPGKGTGKW